jgi:ubiquinone/menaquinone biosynthesis C-methylase UbiE
VVAADTHQLPFPDAAFDCAMVAFGLRNLGDLERGLRELARVVRPGGQLLVLEFFRSRRPWLAAPVEAYLRRGVPLLGRLAGRDGQAYGYLSSSMQRFVAIPEFLEALAAAGFSAGQRVRPQTLGVAHLIEGRRP